MRRWSSILAVIGVLILAYVAGVVPAPATVTVDHCYVSTTAWRISTVAASGTGRECF
jgi:hypothetical protein